MKRARRSLTALLAALLAFALFSTAASAASYELSATAKKSFDNMAEAAGGTLRKQLAKQYDDFLALQRQERSREAEIKELGKANDESLKAVRERIKQIDAAKIEPLKRQLDAAKEKYKPLLEQYTAVNKQISAAKPLKLKELNALLKLQADSLKIPVQLAKQDIKLKENALKAAKDSASAKQKKIRDTLAQIESHEQTIKAEKSAAAGIKKSLDADWKTFSPLVKQGDARSSSDKLAAMLNRLEQMVRHKTNTVNAEKKIAAIIAKAKEQLPPA